MHSLLNDGFAFLIKSRPTVPRFAVILAPEARTERPRAPKWPGPNPKGSGPEPQAARTPKPAGPDSDPDAYRRDRAGPDRANRYAASTWSGLQSTTRPGKPRFLP
jgi:hypothetical protein